MNTRNILSLALLPLAALTLAFTSCDSSDDDDLHVVCPPAAMTMTDSLWKADIVGHKLQWTSTTLIKDGIVTGENYYENMYGISPASYFFAADSVTVYQWSDATGKNTSKKYPYRGTFDPTLHVYRVTIGNPVFHELLVSDKQSDLVTATETIATDSKGNPTVGLTVFKVI